MDNESALPIAGLGEVALTSREEGDASKLSLAFRPPNGPAIELWSIRAKPGAITSLHLLSVNTVDGAVLALLEYNETILAIHKLDLQTRKIEQQLIHVRKFLEPYRIGLATFQIMGPDRIQRTMNTGEKSIMRVTGNVNFVEESGTVMERSP